MHKRTEVGTRQARAAKPGLRAADDVEIDFVVIGRIFHSVCLSVPNDMHCVVFARAHETDMPSAMPNCRLG